MSRLFSIVGDSNIRRNMTGLKSHKSRRGKSKRSEKRGFKRNRHTPPPGEKRRKKAKHYSSSSSSSDGTESSGSGSDSDASESSGSGHARKPNESPEH